MEAPLKLEEFESWLQARYFSPNTVKNYMSIMRRLAGFLNGKPLTVEEVNRWTAHLKRRGASRNAVNTYLLAVRTYLGRFLGLKEMAGRVEPPTRTKTKIPYIPREVFLRMVEAEANLERKTALEILYSSGLRPGELAHLRVQDVNLENCMVRVRVQPGWAPKWLRERDVPISQSAAQDLGKLIRERALTQGYIFQRRGKPVSTRTIERWVKRAAEKAGYNPDAVYAYMLRHSFGVYASRDIGIPDTAHMMGHADWHTTQRYAEASLDQEAIKRFQKSRLNF